MDPEDLWVSPTQARVMWPDAPEADAAPDGTDPLVSVLLAAQELCVEYAPVLAEGAAIPERWRRALVLQARDLWAAGYRTGDVLGFEQYGVTVAPMAGTVKALLRPDTGRPVVG